MPPANTGHVYELADGSFGVQYRLPDGTRKRRSGFRNRTEARRWHADNVLPALNGRRRVAASELTLAELADRYLKRHEAIRSPRTIATLRERLARPLAAYGDVRLVELEGMSDELADFRATLPPRYAHKVMGALRQVFAAGIRWRLLTANPAADAGANPEPKPRPVRAYTLAELDALAAELEPRYAPLVPFAAATGLRPAEWAALERRDIDRDRRLVHVRGTKTAGSIREVPLTGRALAALEAVPPRIDTPLVFPAPAGDPLELANFRRRVWSPAVDAAGVARPARLYDLRSTFASNALAAGVTVFELARVMGTSVRMIERHYGTLVDGAHAGIAARLDALDAGGR